MKTNESRRRFLTTSGLVAGGMALAATGALGAAAAPAAADQPRRQQDTDVILVHGAWADGSSWSGVIEELQREGYAVRAVQLALQDLQADAALVRHAIDRSPRPVVVAGHSYGGAVISLATAGAARVRGLVFVAAYALDEGETLTDQNARFPGTPVLQHLVFDDQGDATLDDEGFVEVFAAGVPPQRARVLAAVQKPISGALFAQKGATPGWRTIPSYFQISADDQVINPDLERFNARRMGARTLELRAGHLSMVTHPHQISELIEQAAGRR